MPYYKTDFELSHNELKKQGENKKKSEIVHKLDAGGLAHLLISDSRYANSCATKSCCGTSLLLKVTISASMSDLSDHQRFVTELFTKLHISDRKAAEFRAARGGFLSWGAFESPHRRDDTREGPRLLFASTPAPAPTR